MKKHEKLFTFIILTGSPAVGKLSVGMKLHRKLGFPMFHNHMTRDLFLAALPNVDKKARVKLREKLESEIIDTAAKGKQSLIITHAYSKDYASVTGKSDTAFVKFIKKTAEGNSGECFVIHLTATEKEILKRTQGSSRKKFTKIKDPNELKPLFKQYDLVSAPPVKDVIVIDTTNKTLAETVKIILDKMQK